MKLNATINTIRETKSEVPSLDVKAEFEAAKRDIFKDEFEEENSPDSAKAKLFFRPPSSKNEHSCVEKPVTLDVNNKFPAKNKLKRQLNDEDDKTDALKNMDASKGRPNKQKSANKDSSSSQDSTQGSGSDYDPTDDAYYEDAEFVYPRIDVTSELAEEDFSWRPGQRKKPKTGDKRKGSNSSKSIGKFDDSFDPFFAPDEPPFEENITYQHDSDESPEAVRKPLPERPSSTPISTSSLSSAAMRERDRPKKGFATAKQRLGKLLKLDKTGTRYVR